MEYYTIQYNTYLFVAYMMRDVSRHVVFVTGWACDTLHRYKCRICERMVHMTY